MSEESAARGPKAGAASRRNRLPHFHRRVRVSAVHISRTCNEQASTGESRPTQRDGSAHGGLEPERCPASQGLAWFHLHPRLPAADGCACRATCFTNRGYRTTGRATAKAARPGLKRHQTPCDGANDSFPFAPETRSALKAAKAPRSRCARGLPTPSHTRERAVRSVAGRFQSGHENVTR